LGEDPGGSAAGNLERRKTMDRNVQRKSAGVYLPERKKSVPYYWMMLGIVMAAVAGYYLVIDTDRTAQAVPGYAEEDVVRDGLFLAIHEMSAGSTIPFLPADQPQPKLVVPNEYHDFGTIGPNDVVKRIFVIRNEGAAPLTISRAYTTCGCTTAEFTARVIPPGKVALVTLIFDAGFHDTRGQTVDRGIIIENNDPGNSQAELWARAAVGWR
jgi:hypothetical protein